MGEQQRWDDDVGPDLSIIAAGKPHMACLLLLDTSGSMNGRPIDQLNKAINGFKPAVLQDSETRDKLDVAILTFDNTTETVQPFLPISEMQSVNLQADGQTFMVPAIKKAIKMITERAHFYEQYTTPYKPWIVMISDGKPNDYNDLDRVVSDIRDLEERGKLNFFSLGVQGFDESTLLKISPKLTFALEGYNFSTFFTWLGKSMRAVGNSRVGDEIESPVFPDNMRRITFKV